MFFYFLNIFPKLLKPYRLVTYLNTSSIYNLTTPIWRLILVIYFELCFPNSSISLYINFFYFFSYPLYPYIPGVSNPFTHLFHYFRSLASSLNSLFIFYLIQYVASTLHRYVPSFSPYSIRFKTFFNSVLLPNLIMHPNQFSYFTVLIYKHFKILAPFYVPCWFPVILLQRPGISGKVIITIAIVLNVHFIIVA